MHVLKQLASHSDGFIRRCESRALEDVLAGRCWAYVCGRGCNRPRRAGGLSSALLGIGRVLVYLARTRPRRRRHSSALTRVNSWCVSREDVSLREGRSLGSGTRIRFEVLGEAIQVLGLVVGL
jgi:hypothetical protein